MEMKNCSRISIDFLSIKNQFFLWKNKKISVVMKFWFCKAQNNIGAKNSRDYTINDRLIAILRDEKRDTFSLSLCLVVFTSVTIFPPLFRVLFMDSLLHIPHHSILVSLRYYGPFTPSGFSAILARQGVSHGATIINIHAKGQNPYTFAYMYRHTLSTLSSYLRTNDFPDIS